jgi:hypothetical protein
MLRVLHGPSHAGIGSGPGPTPPRCEGTYLGGFSGVVCAVVRPACGRRRARARRGSRGSPTTTTGSTRPPPPAFPAGRLTPPSPTPTRPRHRSAPTACLRPAARPNSLRGANSHQHPTSVTQTGGVRGGPNPGNFSDPTRPLTTSPVAGEPHNPPVPHPVTTCHCGHRHPPLTPEHPRARTEGEGGGRGGVHKVARTPTAPLTEFRPARPRPRPAPPRPVRASSPQITI